MVDCVERYFRCSPRYLKLSVPDPDIKALQTSCANRAESKAVDLSDLFSGGAPEFIRDAFARSEFDIAALIEDLRNERYAEYGKGRSCLSSVSMWMYYAVRPFLSVAVRRHLQRMYFRNWNKRTFPEWPVDRTVDSLLRRALLQLLNAAEIDQIPFIWFWPDGASSGAIMTHDVETRDGRDFCSTLMDIDDAFEIKAAFQVVPEQRYEVTVDFLHSITDRGFELGIQDLNHDGRLFRDRELFVARAAKINSYGHQWQAQGFRAAVLYRNQSWFEALEFSYDMSVPNVAHLDPQHGGCCTVMPYFIGKILELPVTTTQDYSLFHFLNDYSIRLWIEQINLIREFNGLVSFIVHPDYILKLRERRVYEALLAHLAELRSNHALWITTPSCVNRWWRQRAEMEIVEDGGRLTIVGVGCERARIAYARRCGSGVEFMVEGSVCSAPQTTFAVEV